MPQPSAAVAGNMADRSSPQSDNGSLRLRWIHRVIVFLRSLCLAIGVCFLVATSTPLDYWWAKAYTGSNWEQLGDVLVVLGGGDWADGQMSWNTYLRVTHALYVYRQGHFSTVLLSGGGNPPVATAMRAYLISQGIPPNVILTEGGSDSTRENALNCKPILDRLGGRKLLLTSDYHTFRAVRAFRAAGVNVLASPAPDILKQYRNVTARWTCFLELVRESAKIAYYGARGWI